MITIDYTPLAPNLHRQLRGKCSLKSITHFETIRSAINYLKAQQILTPKAVNGAFNRLTAEINFAAQVWALDKDQH
jgi:hypothetical protein